jgi:hypothetical protein
VDGAAEQPADRRPDARDGEHGHIPREPRKDREKPPHTRAGKRHTDAIALIGKIGDRYLEEKRQGNGQGHDDAERREAQTEPVTDVRKEDAEGGPVELVDGVEAE